MIGPRPTVLQQISIGRRAGAWLVQRNRGDAGLVLKTTDNALLPAPQPEPAPFDEEASIAPNFFDGVERNEALGELRPRSGLRGLAAGNAPLASERFRFVPRTCRALRATLGPSSAHALQRRMKAEGRKIMMRPYSPSPRWLPVPGIGFPQNVLVGPNVLDPEDFRDWAFAERRRTDNQDDAPVQMIDLIASRPSSWPWLSARW